MTDPAGAMVDCRTRLAGRAMPMPKSILDNNDATSFLRGRRRADRAWSDPYQRQRFPCHPGRSREPEACQIRCRLLAPDPPPAAALAAALAGADAWSPRRRRPISSCATPPRAASASPSAIGPQRLDHRRLVERGRPDLRDALQGRAVQPLLVRARHRLRPRRRMGRASPSCARPTSRSRSGGFRIAPQRGYKRTGFFEVDTQEAKDWTIRLTDPSEGGARAK